MLIKKLSFFFVKRVFPINPLFQLRSPSLCELALSERKGDKLSGAKFIIYGPPFFPSFTILILGEWL
jgi:hypothetical protein